MHGATIKKYMTKCLAHDSECRENECSENHDLLRGVNDLL
jgi:hypothetical protein